MLGKIGFKKCSRYSNLNREIIAWAVPARIVSTEGNRMDSREEPELQVKCSPNIRTTRYTSCGSNLACTLQSWMWCLGLISWIPRTSFEALCAPQPLHDETMGCSTSPNSVRHSGHLSYFAHLIFLINWIILWILQSILVCICLYITCQK